MSTPARGGMSSDEVARVKAAVHQLLHAAETADRATPEYRALYESTMRRIAQVDKSGRKRKARLWRDAVRRVKFIDPRNR